MGESGEVDCLLLNDTQRYLECFVKVILATGSDEVFREQWGTYPLVMEKYEVLYEIITEKLGVEL